MSFLFGLIQAGILLQHNLGIAFIFLATCYSVKVLHQMFLEFLKDELWEWNSKANFQFGPTTLSSKAKFFLKENPVPATSLLKERFLENPKQWRNIKCFVKNIINLTKATVVKYELSMLKISCTDFYDL